MRAPGIRCPRHPLPAVRTNESAYIIIVPRCVLAVLPLWSLARARAIDLAPASRLRYTAARPIAATVDARHSAEASSLSRRRMARRRPWPACGGVAGHGDPALQYGSSQIFKPDSEMSVPETQLVAQNDSVRTKSRWRGRGSPPYNAASWRGRASPPYNAASPYFSREGGWPKSGRSSGRRNVSLRMPPRL